MIHGILYRRISKTQLDDDIERLGESCCSIKKTKCLFRLPDQEPRFTINGYVANLLPVSDGQDRIVRIMDEARFPN